MPMSQLKSDELMATQPELEELLDEYIRKATDSDNQAMKEKLKEVSNLLDETQGHKTFKRGKTGRNSIWFEFDIFFAPALKHLL